MGTTSMPGRSFSRVVGRSAQTGTQKRIEPGGLSAPPFCDNPLALGKGVWGSMLFECKSPKPIFGASKGRLQESRGRGGGPETTAVGKDLNYPVPRGTAGFPIRTSDGEILPSHGGGRGGERGGIPRCKRGERMMEGGKPSYASRLTVVWAGKGL